MTFNTKPPVEKEPRSPKRWRCGDPPEYKHSPKHGGKPLQKTHKWIKDYDTGMCDAWRDEIEKLLIFAGLFAATVTAFVIDSYKWLQEDDAVTSTKLLAQISLQLAAMANNSTQPTVSLPDSSAFVPLPRNVRINAVWFLSLVTCLSTVVLGILCLQWLREYTRESSLGSFDAIVIRQIRYEGLFYWKVPDLISFLPIALQASVLLFFGGILDLLWSLQPAVAVVTTIAIGLVAAVLIFTTIAPAIQSVRYLPRPVLPAAAMKQCPYKSPFSWLLLRLALYVDRRKGLASLKGWLTSWEEIDVAWDVKREGLVWEGQNVYDVQGLAKALTWTINKLEHVGAQSDVIHDIFHSLRSDLPRVVSHKTLQSWASSTRYTSMDHTLRLALSLNECDLLERNHNVQYDLLMMWFLQTQLSQCGFDCDELQMELRLRCLNTLMDQRQMTEMFHEVLRIRKLVMTSSVMEDVSELHFQTMATTLDYHLGHSDLCSPVRLFYQEHIGQAVAEYIQCTPVKADNALMCYEIYKRFEKLFEGVCSSMQHLSTPAHAHTDEETGVPLYPLLAVALLGHLDLRKVETWEENITTITGKRISVSSRLNSYLEQHVLPALDAQDTLASSAMQIRHQLDAYRDIVHHSDTTDIKVDDGNGNGRGEAPVT